MTQQLIPQWMIDLGHKFDVDDIIRYDNGRCHNCAIQFEYLARTKETMKHSPKRFEREYSCGFDPKKYEQEQDSHHKIKKLPLNKFLKMLLEFDEMERSIDYLRTIHNFNEIYKWFWDNHKISRWSVEVMFDELSRKEGTGYTLRYYGASFPRHDDKPCRIYDKLYGLKRNYYTWMIVKEGEPTP